MALRTLLCTRTFRSPQKKPRPWAQSLPVSRLTDPPSASVGLLVLGLSYKWNRTLRGLLYWLFSFSQMFSGFVHDGTYLTPSWGSVIIHSVDIPHPF